MIKGKWGEAIFLLLLVFPISLESKGVPRNNLTAASWRILQNADKFEVLSISPSSGSFGDHLKTRLLRRKMFHQFTVLGETEVKEAEVRQKIIEALKSDVKQKIAREHCFDPHHGIRAVRNNREVDLVLSFECHYLYVFDGRNRQGLTVGSSVEPLLNAAIEQ
jgi:hypothetical protein